MMKIKLNQRIISTLGMVAILFIFLFKAGFFSYKSYYYFEDAYHIEETRLDTLNDKIKQLKSRADSLNNEKRAYVDRFAGFSGWTFGPIGIGDVNTHQLGNNEAGINEDCIKFTSIGLKINEEVGKYYLNYHTKNGNGYLSTMKFTKQKEFTAISYIDKKVGFKYLSSDDQVYVQVHSGLLKFLGYLFSFVFILFFIALHLFIIITFFNFLLAITKNDAFEFGNVQRLKDISLAMFIAVASQFFINGIVYIIFICAFTSEGVNFKYWEPSYLYLACSIFFYLLYTAFKRGMVLKQENDLTI